MRRFLTPTFIKALLHYWLGKSKTDPIFIVGSGRCGSSLLVDVLASNPGIHISQFEWYHTFLKTLKNSANAKPMVTDITDIRKISEDSIKAWTVSDSLFIKVMFKYFASKDSSCYILKSPAISLLLSELQELFPKAKYIHMIRDGYAVTHSLYKKEYFRDKRYQSFFTEQEFKQKAASYWNDSLAAIDVFFNSLDDAKYYDLYYEPFTQAPLDYMGPLADFIGVTNSFAFDFATIKGTNHKISNLSAKDLSLITPIMEPMLKRHQYKTRN